MNTCCWEKPPQAPSEFNQVITHSLRCPLFILSLGLVTLSLLQVLFVKLFFLFLLSCLGSDTGHDMSWRLLFNGQHKFYWSKRRQENQIFFSSVTSWFSICFLIVGIYNTFARPEGARKSWTSVHSATVFARRLGHYICVEYHLCAEKICFFCTQRVCQVPW